jgi:DNA-binding transcriptional LysR family regulator
MRSGARRRAGHRSWNPHCDRLDSLWTSRWLRCVSAGLGVSIVPQPRPALLEAHGVRGLGLGRGGPTRQIAVVRRRADAVNRNIDAVSQALAVACR